MRGMSFRTPVTQLMVNPENDVRILVVDDVPDKLVALAAILDEPGQIVVGVPSGARPCGSCCRKTSRSSCSTSTCPTWMASRPRPWFASANGPRHTPIIFITADCDETHARHGYSLGAVDYILAPVIPEVLRAKVGVFVELYRKNQQLQRQMNERVTLAREQAARAAAEQANCRSQFLAEASRVLSRSLHQQAIVDGLLPLLVPEMAEFVSLGLLDSQSAPAFHELAWAAGPKLNRAWVEARALPAGLADAIGAVAATGRPGQPADLGRGELASLLAPANVAGLCWARWPSTACRWACGSGCWAY